MALASRDSVPAARERSPPGGGPYLSGGAGKEEDGFRFSAFTSHWSVWPQRGGRRGRRGPQPPGRPLQLG